MSKKRIVTVQGRGSRITSPPHQLGIELGGADHIGTAAKAKAKVLEKSLKDTVKAIKAGS